ncbi:hypothetical protein [Sulfuriroseicoccus oceanibius]|uniref:Uncharacterized protein n=1 Tax=Sulfuriroseicoccus oceanibius TaxID=2707525 RepID=A0A6B3L871_9BACT|nr:hypothetical protein [Sulfuriroseicoccus oceanibius]QQL43711.1 hypothetical protein G3M56_007305 [Sulfuriroseicoccus oceanibius]
MKDQTSNQPPVEDLNFPDSFATNKILEKISQQYGCKALGGGDVKQGLNMLSALSAAATQILPRDVEPTRGASLIAGGFSIVSGDEVFNARVRSELITPLRESQNWAISKADFVTRSLQMGLAPKMDLNPAQILCRGGTSDEVQAKLEQWMSPRVLVTGSSPGGMAKLLSQAHNGRALVVATIDSRSQADSLGSLVGDLLTDGYTTSLVSGDPGISVTGEVLAMTNNDTAREIASLAGQGSWVHRCVWLDASKAEFDLEAEDRSARGYRPLLERLYKMRVGVDASRIGMYRVPARYVEQWNQFAAEWAGGDSSQIGLAHKIFPSLGVGLHLVWTSPQRIPEEIWLWAFHLGKYLLLQSRDVRVGLRHGAELALVENAALRILPKMDDTPMTVREISRRCSSMRAELCRTALKCLTAAGYLEELENKWRIDPNFSAEADLKSVECAKNAVFLPTLKGGRFNREFLAQLEMTR